MVSVSLADALDLGAHRDQAGGEIDDLGLARGILDHGRALGEDRRHQRILGRADRDRAGSEMVPPRRPPFGRGRLHIAGGELDLGAERLAAPSDAGRSAGCRSRSRRAATPSPRRRARAAARARGSRRASCGRCRRARRSRRCVAGAEASSPGRTRPCREPSTVVETPSWLSRWPKLSTSASRGRLRRVSGSSVSSAQGIRVSAAFFAPEIGMRPVKRLAAAMMIRSIRAVLPVVDRHASRGRGAKKRAGSARP